MAHRVGIAAVLAMACLCATALGQDWIKVDGFDVIGIGGAGGIFTPTVHPDDPNILFVSCDMSGMYRSADSGKTWHLLHYKQISNCNRIRPTFSRDAMYWLREPNTLLASKDKGLTWSPAVAEPSPFKGTLTHLLASREKDGFLLVGSDAGAWCSSDSGQTWKQISQDACSGLALLGDAAFVAGKPAGAEPSGTLLCSKDGGQTWASLPVEQAKTHAITSLAGASDKNASCLYATVQDVGLVQSLDQGVTWNVVQPWDKQADVLILPGQTQVAYVAQKGIQMWRTTDGGKTWNGLIQQPGAANVDKHWTQTLLSWGYYIVPLGMGIDPTNPERAFMATQAELDCTTDGGKTWKQITDVALDGGKRLKSTGLEVTVSSGYLISPSNPKDHYIQYQDIGFARSRDGGESWSWSATGCPWSNTFYAVLFDPFVKDRMYAAASRKHMIPDWIAIGTESRESAGGICASDDRGSTWRVLGKDSLPLLPATALVIDPKSTPDNLTMYAGLYDGGVYKSTDSGKTWVNKSKGLGNAGNMHVCRLYMSPKSGNLYCLITGSRTGRDFKVPGGLWRSTDGGESWHDLTAEAKLLWPTDVAVSADEKTLVISAATTPGAAQGGAYRSTDDGKTWQRTFTDQDAAKWMPPSFVQALTVKFHPDQPDLVYLGTGQGLWYSQDAGKSWKVYEQVPFRSICALTFDPANTKRMFICTYGVSVLGGPCLP